MESASDLVMNWRSVMMAMLALPALACGLILILRRLERRASIYLGAFLILAALGVGPQILGYAGGYQIWPWMTFFPLFFTEAWMGPLLIAHSHALMRGGPLGWKRWLFAPAIVQALYTTYAFVGLEGGMLSHEAKWAFSRTVHTPYIVPLESLIGIALLALALVIVWRDRADYLRFLDATQSAARDYDPVWLRNLVLVMALGFIVYAGIEVADYALALSYDAAFPLLALLMAMLAWLGLDAAWRLTSPFPKIACTDTTSVESPLSEDWAARLQSAMTTEQWYLEPRLSIAQVARRLGTNATYISRALNRSLGQSFNAYVNGLRVEEASQLLRTTDANILDIALQSGFNSKATFNRVFRDLTGHTPTQFRKAAPVLASQIP